MMNFESTESTASSSTDFVYTEVGGEQWFHLEFSWSGKNHSITVAQSDRVFDLKLALHNLTRVPPIRQKILGLVKGKLPPDQVRIADLGLFHGKKFTLVGTPEGDEFKDPPQSLVDDVIDLDADFTDDLVTAALHMADQRTIRKIKEATDRLDLNIISPLGTGKKLLVLDIDYTILDTKPLTSGSLPPEECARPKLHEFLEAIYPYYDICIWSQNSWVWLETKLIELGMIGANRNYNISFVLDKTSMFTVFTERDGKPWSHSVKPLQIIWNRFPQFDASNTIHVDDLSRNFALNPKQGLKIHAFKNAHTLEGMADRELDKLTKYLLRIAVVEDLRTLSHKDWKRKLKSFSQSP